ncbi:MAG: GH39 family glycosyl hydrolase [Solirubrobacteraceae bacterium]
MARQAVEADTLYLLDADVEDRLTFANYGLIPGNNFAGSIWKPGADVVKAPGKYRSGIESNNLAFGYAKTRQVLSAAEFTIEMWVYAPEDWGSYVLTYPTLCTLGGVSLLVNRGGLRVDVSHAQDPSGPVAVHMPVPPTSPILARTWTHVAVTYGRDALIGYINGVQRAQVTGIPAPMHWPVDFTIGGAAGVGAKGFVISDLRISRTARTPGRVVPLKSGNVLTVEPGRRTGGVVQQTLLGGLHTLGNTATERMAAGKLKLIRTDKLLTATPMRAGGVDALHPHRGRSGQFAYDWQVVDRTLDYVARLGLEAYISIDSTPQILGGSVAPFTGRILTSERSYTASFSPEVPNDMAAFRTIVQDLIHHIVVEKGYRVPYWGVWNEPDGTTQFLRGKVGDYLAIYDACAAAVKATDPRLKVGGPEIGDQMGSGVPYLEALVRHCARQQVPLDFVSVHNYSGDVTQFQALRTQVDQLTRRYGLATPMELITGEWSFSAIWVPRTGYPPYKAYDYFHNDHMAGFMAWSLIEMQRTGVVKGVFWLPVGDVGIVPSSLMGSSQPYVGLNVFDMWSRLAPHLVSQALDADPGMCAQASVDDAGQVTILVANLHFRKEADQTLTINLPGLSSRARVTHHVIDDHHSNFYEAGAGHAGLEAIEPPVPAGEAIHISVKSRSVHLLTIA